MQHGAEAGRNVILQVCTHWCLPMKQRQLWAMTRSLDQNKLIMAVRGIYLGILWMHDQVIFSPSTSVTWKSSHVLLCLVEPEAGRPNVEQIKKVQQVNDWRQTERGLRSKIICTCGWTVCLSEVTGTAVIGSLLSGRKNNYSAGKSWWPWGFLLFFWFAGGWLLWLRQ